MRSSRVKVANIAKEVELSTSRSSGPGGQHVNKVETKVTLRWNVDKSEVLSNLDKEIIKVAIGTKLTKEGELIITSHGHRSQIKNKEIAFKKLDKMLAKAFFRKKPRKKTQPTKASKVRRLTSKKRQSEKKELRKKIQ